MRANELKGFRLKEKIQRAEAPITAKERAKTDERYRNWLFSVQGAKRTRGVT